MPKRKPTDTKPYRGPKPQPKKRDHSLPADLKEKVEKVRKAGPGRISEYRPEMVEEVIAFAKATGLSLSAYCGSISIAWQTLHNWRKQHPDFDEACQIAKAIRAQRLEAEAMESTSGPAINFRVLALRNIAPEEWNERVDHRIGGLPGAPPIGTVSAQVDVSKFTPDQVYNFILNGAELPKVKDDDAEPSGT